MRNRLVMLGIVACLFGVQTQTGLAQGGFGRDTLSVTPILSQQSARPGGKVELTIQTAIEDGFHINSNTPSEEFLIPTELTVDPIEGIAVGEPKYPPHHLYKFEFSENDLAIYDGTISIRIELEIQDSAPTGTVEISGSLRYQACDDKQCLPPRNAKFSIALEILSDKSGSVGGSSRESTISKIDLQATAADKNGDSIFQRGYILMFIAIFFGGLALNLTPCVYPIIPITIGFFGNQAEGSTRRTAFLAIIYVLGIAVTYSALGTMAALTGNLFGAVLQNPFVLGFVALVIVGLALWSFGLFELSLPSSLTSRIGSGRQGAAGALFMGLTVGFVAAPCIGPFVVALLIEVGQRGSPLFGFTSFLTLALGMGFPYIFLALFAGSLHTLPKSGAWMIWVKKIFGYVLLGVAVFFLRPVLPEILKVVLFTILGIAASLHLGWFDKSAGASRVFRKVQIATGSLVLLITVGYVALQPRGDVQKAAPAWRHYTEESFASLLAEEKPLIIDFYADWCVACVELDKFTFSDSRVIEKSQSFNMVKVDLTSEDDEEANRYYEKMNVLGMPTIVFMNSAGEERTDLRLAGFEKADLFLKRMDAVLNENQTEGRPLLPH